MGVQNLLGQNFNYLTVIEGPIIKNKKTYWICKCICGNIKEIRADQLKSGATKSCGCYKNNIFIENNKIRQTLDLTNKKFGKLTALEKTEQRKNGRVVWKCKCDCGNIIYTDTHSLQEGRINSCGCLISKGENKISQLLQANNIDFVTQKTFSDCKFADTGYYAKFDFWVNNNYLIEYDGEQHFYYKKSSYTWNNKENYNKVIAHDQYKNQWCKEHNIPLIRIPYIQLKKLTIDDLLLEKTTFRTL